MYGRYVYIFVVGKNLHYFSPFFLSMCVSVSPRLSVLSVSSCATYYYTTYILSFLSIFLWASRSLFYYCHNIILLLLLSRLYSHSQVKREKNAFLLLLLLLWLSSSSTITTTHYQPQEEEKIPFSSLQTHITPPYTLATYFIIQQPKPVVVVSQEGGKHITYIVHQLYKENQIGLEAEYDKDGDWGKYIHNV